MAAAKGKSLTINYDKLCRICLKSEKVKHLSLFEPFKNSCPAHLINSLTNIHIIEDDNLPGKICNKCLLDLETAINFKEKCVVSNTYLHNTLSKDDDSELVNIEPKIELKVEPNSNLSEESSHSDQWSDKEEPLQNTRDDKLDMLENHDINEGCSFSDIKDDVPAKTPIIICNKCGEVFEDKIKFRTHRKKDHKLRIRFTCDLCKMQFSSMNAFIKHKARIEKCKRLSNSNIVGFGKNRKFSCRDCSYSSNSTNGILQHQLVHSGERKYHCDICNKSFSTPGPRSVHMENVHKMYKKVITCEVCGLKLFGQSKFYRHMKKHNPTYYECDLCHKKVQSKFNLRNHLKRHAGVKNFSCEFCPKVVTTSAELANHKRLKHLKIPFPKKYMECPICKYKTYTTGSMKSHQEKHTSDNVACEVCGKFFDSNLHLWVHKMCHMPNTVERRTCPFCSKLCETAAATRKHMVVHLNKKDMNYNADQVVSRIQYVWSGVIQKPDITLNMRKRKKKETKETTDVPFPANFPKIETQPRTLPTFPKPETLSGSPSMFPKLETLPGTLSKVAFHGNIAKTMT